jgi:hypothetical protein
LRRADLLAFTSCSVRGTLGAVATTDLTADDAESTDYWRSLEPKLSIEGERAAPKFDVGDVDQAMKDLRVEGYVNLPGVVPKNVYVPLRECIARLHERRIPLPFAFVYDEMWQVFQGISAFIGAALGPGYRALPDFWVWHVVADDAVTGWSPHRDRTQPTVERDNSPHTLTVWLPFTEATPLNGCIYVIPAHLDKAFARRQWDGPDNIAVHEPQNVRALPAPAGSLLAWNQGVLHWGGRASRLAKAPRTSAAFEFQRGDKEPFNTPLLDPKITPPFTQRLGLIGKQALQYKHMYPLTPDVAAIAETLSGRYRPGAALMM